MLVETEHYRYELMQLKQIRAVISGCPVAIQATGLMEWHGEHNAIGLDG
jgi:creatinine amidohydrolase/Fe(II)-dependent formamide hydrolase-like protein